ncbi:MAG: hypothetical protein V3T72_12140 [Thermoanaerobaculia bacterium]
MGRDPLSICREYLRSASPSTRGRAVAAMAAMAALDAKTGAASAAALARSALEDEDESVRGRAESVIAGLGGEPLEIALANLHQALGKPSTRLRAYALLTRLGNHGVAARGTSHSLGERLRLAFAAHRAAVLDRDRIWSPEDRRALHQRAVFWSVGFTLVGAVLGSFLIATKANTASAWSIVVLFAAALVMSPLVARAACSAAQPGDRYLHRIAGWLAEVLGTGVGVLPALAIVDVLLLVSWPAIGDVEGMTVALAGLGLLAYGWLIVIAIRTATASSAVVLRRSWWSTLAGTFAGWGAGVATATGVLYLSRRLLASAQHGVDLVDLAAGFWLLALPLSAAVAAALARLERDTAPPDQLRWKPLLVLPSLLGGVLLIGCWTWLFLPRAQFALAGEELPIAAPREASRVLSGTFRRLPALLPFEIEFPQQVKASETGKMASAIILRVCQDRLMRTEADGPLIEDLDPGVYQLEIAERPQDRGRALRCFRPNLFDELFDLARRLARYEELLGTAGDENDARFYALGARSTAAFTVELTLNSDPSRARSAQP